LAQLRESGGRPTVSVFLVDAAHVLTGQARIADIALADPATELGALQRPVAATVQPMDSIEKVADSFEGGDVLERPVCDANGVIVGVIAHDDLTHTLQEDATVSIQTMVGASREERALSTPLFAVRKRMPWLQINLLTAFLAAAIVGIFQDTIAQVTALAVLLPIVAGQSGNAGAQALAITMRGLALREITVRQWAKVVCKEVLAGLLNGIGVALTCGVGVYLWSQSVGLVAVIALSMVLSMVIAGFAGALTPIVLRRLGQDPATSSSIILTTITEIVGFLSFLGIAAAMIEYL
jgi:magnesium transporter